MGRPLCFDAVVFDLDGTLVATDRFWVDAARVGAKRAFQELGLERAMPSADEWMSMVGLPLAMGFELVFPDLDPMQRALVLARCVEEEERALKAGQAALLPGVVETLDALRSAGVRIGIASNCGNGYLHSMLHELGLARWAHEARCLDTPRMRNKATMVHDLLETFGTRSAVMVGDRLTDRDAAWENGLPHVHYARGFAAAGEMVEAEATIESMADLVALLERRGAWIEGALEALGAFGKQPLRSLAITGHSGSGKSLFARDAARVLAARGRQAVVVSFDAFLRGTPAESDLTRTAFVTPEHALDHVRAAFDVDGLAAVLEAHAKSHATSVRTPRATIEVPADATLIVEGLFLLHPDLRPHFERAIHLAVDETVGLRRIAGREAWTRGPESVLVVRRHHLPTQRAFDERRKPAELADLVLESSNALGTAVESA